MFSRVDFPQPDGPMIATNSLSATSRLTLFSASVSTSVVTNFFVMFSNLIMIQYVFCMLLLFFFSHSVLMLSTGLALAVFQLCNATVANVMTAISANAATNSRGVICVFTANDSSQRVPVM